MSPKAGEERCVTIYVTTFGQANIKWGMMLSSKDLEKVFLLSLYNVDFMNRMIASKLLVTQQETFFGVPPSFSGKKEHLLKPAILSRGNHPTSTHKHPHMPRFT